MIIFAPFSCPQLSYQDIEVQLSAGLQLDPLPKKVTRSLYSGWSWLVTISAGGSE